LNHKSNLPVEASTDRYEMVEASLGRLNFPVSPPRYFQDGRYTLVGGRYCSIQGEMAAQLKVNHRDSGEISTLYITPLTEPLNTIPVGTKLFKEYQIRITHENDLFYGLIRNRGN